MKRRLIILSDLWGFEANDWIKYYLNILNAKYDIKCYDCCEIGNIDKRNYTEQNIHLQFINHGIDTATKKLIELEPNAVDILAFSIGGTIAWKAGLKGLIINNFYAVSSTRLRYETAQPDCNIKLFYGKKDKFKPATSWFDTMQINFEIIQHSDHDMYRNEDFAMLLSEVLKAPH